MKQNEANDQPPPNWPADVVALVAAYELCSEELQEDIRRFALACKRSQQSPIKHNNIVPFPIKSSLVTA